MNTLSETELQEDHELLRPCLRAVEAFSVEYEGKEMVALRDRSNLTDGVTLVTPPALWIIQHFTGEADVHEIAERVGVGVEVVTPLVKNLDEALLLHGKRFEAHHQQVLDEFDRMESLPIRSAEDFTTAWMDETLEKARGSEAFQSWKEKVSTGGDGACCDLIGVVAPHLDTERGEINYGLSYAAVDYWLSDCNGKRPDRVIVFGTNHFGAGTGVVMADKDQQTTAGLVHSDHELAQVLSEALGERLTEARLDHLREHSVELQLPWIRRVIGEVPVLGFLVHDPTVILGASYDGRGVALDEFIEALRGGLGKLGGRTLFVASADLSHIGPEFGDTEINDSKRLEVVGKHDITHLGMLVSGEIDEFLGSMTQNHNATKWCTLGGLAALWQMVPELSEPRLLHYHQAVKHPGYEDLTRCCVTSASMVIGCP